MRAICLYLHIHQPWRYRRYSIFDVAHNHNYWYENDYYDKQNNERIFRKVSEKSYKPMLALLERNLKRYPGFKVSLSITGTWLEQALEWEPELLEQIRRMVSVRIFTVPRSMSAYVRSDSPAASATSACVMPILLRIVSSLFPIVCKSKISIFLPPNFDIEEL